MTANFRSKYRPNDRAGWKCQRRTCATVISRNEIACPACWSRLPVEEPVRVAALHIFRTRPLLSPTVRALLRGLDKRWRTA